MEGENETTLTAQQLLEEEARNDKDLQDPLNGTNTGDENEGEEKEIEEDELAKLIGQRTKAEQDRYEKGAPPTLEELQDKPQEPMTVEELYEYADMLIDALTIGLVTTSRAISLNTMTEQQLSPSKEKLKTLKKVTTKVLYKYQARAPLLFLFFLTLIMVYFPTFRDSWISRKAFKNKNKPEPPKPEKTPQLAVKKKDEKPSVTLEKAPVFEDAKVVPETPEEEVAKKLKDELNSVQRGTKVNGRKGVTGRKKKGFQYPS